MYKWSDLIGKRVKSPEGDYWYVNSIVEDLHELGFMLSMSMTKDSNMGSFLFVNGEFEESGWVLAPDLDKEMDNI